MEGAQCGEASLRASRAASGAAGATRAAHRPPASQLREFARGHGGWVGREDPPGEAARAGPGTHAPPEGHCPCPVCTGHPSSRTACESTAALQAQSALAATERAGSGRNICVREDVRIYCVGEASARTAMRARGSVYRASTPTAQPQTRVACSARGSVCAQSLTIAKRRALLGVERHHGPEHGTLSTGALRQ